MYRVTTYPEVLEQIAALPAEALPYYAAEPDMGVSDRGEQLRSWVGHDDCSVELEIAAVVRPGCLLVLHVMPTDLPRKR